MTDTTEARRALLSLLLDRVEREALLPAEAPLLRPLVAAEIGHGQAMIDQFTTEVPWLKAMQEDLTAETRRSLEAEAALARARKLAVRWENGLPPDLPYARALRDALDGPSPMPDDAPATPVLDALRTGQPVELLFCSPLVNAACPGHDAPPYCDRAPSSLATPTAAPDWTTAPEPRTYRLTADGNPIERTVVVPSADTPTTAPDDDPADGSSGTPILDEMLAGYRAQHPADDGPSLGACRVMPTRDCPEFHNGPCGDRPCARFESEDPTPWMPEQQADATVTDWATSVDERCPAHYKDAEPGGPLGTRTRTWVPVDYRCERRGHGLDTDHAARQAGDLVFCWTDAIAVYPTSDTTTTGDDAPSGSRRTGTDPDD